MEKDIRTTKPSQLDVLLDVHSPETGKLALIQAIIGAAIMFVIILALDASGIIAH